MATNSLQPYRQEAYITYAETDLSKEDLEVLADYVSGGGHPLSPDTAAKLFELFLNGSNAHEIHALNKAFPLGAILDSQIRYRWTEKRDRYASDLQDRVRDVVFKAQLETTELMANMLSAAAKRNSSKLKKFIQNGNEEDLEGVINIDNIHALTKITEGLLKITGQDRTHKVKTENTQNLNVSVGAAKDSNLAPEDAAAILNILSKAKKNAQGTKA